LYPRVEHCSELVSG